LKYNILNNGGVNQNMQKTETTPKTHGKPVIAEIFNNKSLSDDVFQITLNCEEIAKKSRPGQFVSVLCDDLILRRPFSIAYVDDKNFQIIYKIKGKGTEFMSGLESGKFLNILGPLGKGFSVSDKKALLVGAGVGIAPVMFLSKVLEKNNTPFMLLGGFQKSLKIDEITDKSYNMVTEDGSSNLKGRINDYLEDLISKFNPEKIYACGPEIVLKYTVETAKKYNIELEIALEREFACGIGVCMGCSVKILENDKEINRRICKDGPVFDGRSVIW
jgi:dihydroorotate dehydrogenase electron transfer subunit